MKNPFKKQSIIDTLVNVGVGGAANVAFDYAAANIDALASLTDTTKNAIKIGIGVLGGTMVRNKYVRAAVDGIATVGVSNLVASYIDTPAEEGGEKTPAGLPHGTISGIGRLRMGQRNFARRSRVAGISGADFMGK